MTMQPHTMRKRNAASCSAWRDKQGIGYRMKEVMRVQQYYVPQDQKTPDEREKARERARASMARTRAKRKSEKLAQYGTLEVNSTTTGIHASQWQNRAENTMLSPKRSRRSMPASEPGLPMFDNSFSDETPGLGTRPASHEVPVARLTVRNTDEMEGCVSLPIPGDKLEDLIVQAKDFALSHGIIMRTSESPTSAEVITYAPFVLFPSPVPRVVFEQAQAVQKDFNMMMHRVAHDYAFLKDCLASTIKVDDFTSHMWHIYDTVYKEGIAQPMCLAINRSDYMFDSPLGESSGSQVHLRQIEFNTMASSFGGLSQKLADLHRYILGLCGLKEKATNVPDNKAADGIARAMVTAWTAYSNPDAAVLFLILSTEGNIYDQRWLEYGIKALNPNIKVIRRSIQDMAKRAVLSEDKHLLIDEVEIAIVYQRSCYVPDHFESEKDWEARLLVERSRAIKCPNIAYHLAGTKKVQQVLAQPGMVQKFASSPDASTRIMETFAKLYSLDRGVEGDDAIAAAVHDPQKFVLKPQREGGGNNTYGDDIVSMLDKIKDTDERTAYILMERISPPPHRNYPIRVGAPVFLQLLISELGMYGTLVGTKDKLILNEQTGHNLRTKAVEINEGGVATGYSSLDSPFLV